MIPPFDFSQKARANPNYYGGCLASMNRLTNPLFSLGRGWHSRRAPARSGPPYLISILTVPSFGLSHHRRNNEPSEGSQKHISRADERQDKKPA